jgi:hypothetical protein
MAKPKQNNNTPIVTAKTVSKIVNRSIYFLSGESYVYAFDAKFAIWPINVLSPVAKTTPLPVPYLLRVEKNAMFFVYNGLSFVHYGVLASSYV